MELLHPALTPYMLSRWECNTGCGTFERGTASSNPPASPTCTKCGRSASFLLAIPGLTVQLLPFSTQPRSGFPAPKIRHNHRGGSTGRPKRDKIEEKLPAPEAVRLPGDRRLPTKKPVASPAKKAPPTKGVSRKSK